MGRLASGNSLTSHVIVHQFDPHVPVSGGVDGFIRDLLRLAPARHRFAVVGVDSTGRYVRLGRWYEAELGSRVIQFMPVARLDAGDQRRRIPHTVRVAAGVVRFRPKVDRATLHSHRGEMGALLTSLYRNVDHVQFLHGDAHAALAHRSETFWRFVPSVYLLLERRSVARSRRTIVMSESAAARLAAVSDGVVLGRNWYDSSTFNPSERVSAAVPTVAWAGRMEQPKQPLKAVDVLVRLRELGVRFSGWLAGGGTLRKEVEAAVARSALDVEVLPAIGARQLASRLRRSDVFLMTSMFEGFPRGAVEALACGVPVVAPNVGELGAIVTPGVNGFLSEGGSPGELAELTRAALELRPGESVARTVSHLDAERVIPELLDLIDGR